MFCSCISFCLCWHIGFSMCMCFPRKRSLISCKLPPCFGSGSGCQVARWHYCHTLPESIFLLRLQPHQWHSTTTMSEHEMTGVIEPLIHWCYLIVVDITFTPWGQCLWSMTLEVESRLSRDWCLLDRLASDLVHLTGFIIAFRKETLHDTFIFCTFHLTFVENKSIIIFSR